MIRLLLLTIFTVMLLVPPYSFAGSDNLLSELQGEAEELNTPAESVIMMDIGSNPCTDWMNDRKKPLYEGPNKKTNGEEFFVQTGSAVISAPPGHPNYISSRQNAYVKAFMTAKAAMLEYMETELSREITFSMKEGEFSRDKEAAQKKNKTTEETQFQAIKRKAALLINATLDEKLEEKGVDPDSNNPEDQKAVEQIVQEVVNSTKFSDIIKSSSLQQLKGIRRMFVTESVKQGKQGEICVVALSSDKTMALADAVFSDPSIAPTGMPNKPINQQIPNWRTNKGVKELLSTFGTEMLRDENGEFHVIAYAQSSAKSESKTSQQIAIDKAVTRATAEIRTFSQEVASINKAAENSEKATELANAIQEYEENEAFEKTLSSISVPAKISGIRKIGYWGAKHPLTGQTVYGAIVGWSPSNAITAKKMKSRMVAQPNSSKKAGSNKSNSFKNDVLKAKGSYKGAASGGSSEEDF